MNREMPDTARQLRHPSRAGDRQPPPTFREALRFWLKLGFISFGGPSGQIVMMHSELVEKRKWIGEAHFLHALNFCMLLPGPEAQQLAIYIGWLLHKVRGGIVAGALFVIPSIFILWMLSYVYVAYGNIPWIAAIFYGLKPAVLAIVAAAVIRIGFFRHRCCRQLQAGSLCSPDSAERARFDYVVECSAIRLPSESTITARKPCGPICVFSSRTLPPFDFAIFTASSSRPSTDK